MTDRPTPAAPETADLLAEARILAQTYRRPGMRDDNRVANILDALRSEVATLRASEARMRERIAELEAEDTAMVADIISLQASNEELSGHLQALLDVGGPSCLPELLRINARAALQEIDNDAG